MCLENFGAGDLKGDVFVWLVNIRKSRVIVKEIPWKLETVFSSARLHACE